MHRFVIFLLFSYCLGKAFESIVERIDYDGDLFPGWAKGSCVTIADPNRPNKELYIFATGFNEDWDVNGTFATSDVYVYNYKTNTMTAHAFPTANGTNAPYPRGFVAAWPVGNYDGTHSGDGKLQIFAGAWPSFDTFAQTGNTGSQEDLFFGDLWEFNVITGQWTEIQIQGDIPGVWPLDVGGGFIVNITVGLLGPEAVKLDRDDDIVYIFGGLSVNITESLSDPPFVLYNDVYTYRISTRTFTKLNVQGEKPRPRLYATLVPSKKGFILTGGELLVQDQTDPTIWEFNVETNTWTHRQGVHQLGVQLMVATNYPQDHEKTFIFYGGDTNSTENPCGYFRPAFPSNLFQIYNYKKDDFSAFIPFGDRIPPLKRHCQFTTYDDKILVWGGWTITPWDEGNCQKFPSDLWLLDPNL